MNERSNNSVHITIVNCNQVCIIKNGVEYIYDMLHSNYISDIVTVKYEQTKKPSEVIFPEMYKLSTQPPRQTPFCQ